MSRKIVPDVVAQPTLYTLPSTATIYDAVQLMVKHQIGAVVVLDNNRLSGIFSERDVVARVVALGRDPHKTTLAQVMSAETVTIDKSEDMHKALQIMQDNHFRHLPITEGGKPVGMVSMRDLYAVFCQELQDDVAEKEAFIYSGGY